MSPWASDSMKKNPFPFCTQFSLLSVFTVGRWFVIVGF